MAAIYVSNSAELQSALASATGGETIYLKDGSYGNLGIFDKSYSSFVNIVSENPLGAKFSTVNITGSNNIKIDGVHVDSGSNGSKGASLVRVADGSNNIQFVNSEVNGKVDSNYSGYYGLHSSDSQNIVFANNYVHDVHVGSYFFATTGLQVSGNTYEYMGDDTMKLSSVHNALVENNIGARFYFPEPGAHLDFIQFQGGSSSDVIVRGNVQLPGNNAAAYVQGILLDTPSHTNILIEQNIIVTGMIHGVTATNSDNDGLTVRDNTFLNLPGGTHGATLAMVGGTNLSVSGNIYGVTDGHQLEGLGTNLGLQHTDPGGTWYYGSMFEGTIGVGMTVDDLVPIAGSAATGVGAYERLLELVNGVTSTSQPAPQPEPAPEPEPTPEPTLTPEPEPTPLPEPDPNPGVVQEGLLFLDPSTHRIDSAQDVLELAHDTQWEVSHATIAFSFNADATSGRMGIVAKDAAGFGHHFTSYIQDGVLTLRLQDDGAEKYVRVYGIKSGTDYDVQIAFGDGKATVWLNGSEAGRMTVGTDWTLNKEYLQIGGNGWGSAEGEAGFMDPFKGTISDVTIAQGALSPSELAALAGSTLEPDPTPEPDPEPVPEPNSSGLLFFDPATHTIHGVNDVLEFPHNDQWEVSQATIAFSFNAEDIGGKMGIVAKDSAGFGHHFTSYLHNRNLVLRLQDDNGEKYVRVHGIKPGTDYDVQIAFGDGQATVWVNGSVAGRMHIGTDWTLNSEHLQIGGNGWGSAEGEAGFVDPFNGTISGVTIAEGMYSPSKLAALVAEEMVPAAQLALPATYEELSLMGDLNSSGDLMDLPDLSSSGVETEGGDPAQAVFVAEPPVHYDDMYF